MCKTKVLLIITAALMIISFASLALADAPPLSAELALFTQSELAVTASRIEKPISESPAAITVITREDILRSGATHIPDILRRCAGVNVFSVSPGHSEVNIRGLNTVYSSRTSVLIDGRTVYINGQGFIPWESIPVVIEDIKRIEIVRGPVEALYGSPALSGVINIITRDPEEVKGFESDTSLGTYNTARQAFFKGGTINDKTAYKLSAEFSQLDAFQPYIVKNYLERDALRRQVVNGAVSHKIDDKSRFTLTGGFNNGDFIVLPNPVTGLGPLEHETGFIKLDFDRELGEPKEGREVQGQFFWNRQNFNVTSNLVDQTMKINTYDLDLHRLFKMGERHAMLYGGGMRYEEMEGTLFRTDSQFDMKSELTWDLFFQDEIKLTDLLTFLGTLRLDHHPVTAYNIAYRTSLMYKPSANDMFWFTAGRTFRNPTFSESKLDITYPYIIFTARPHGSEALKPERMNSFELGYKGLVLKRIKPEICLFYTILNDYIFSLSENPSGLDIYAYMRNKGTVRTLGTELSVSYLITDWLKTYINHTYLEARKTELVPVEDATPRHTTNLGASFTFDKNQNHYLLDIFSTFVSHFESPGSTGGGKVTDYSLTNLRIGCNFKDQVETSLYVYNLFKDVHKEYRDAEDMGTRVVGKCTLKF